MHDLSYLYNREFIHDLRSRYNRGEDTDTYQIARNRKERKWFRENWNWGPIDKSVRAAQDSVFISIEDIKNKIVTLLD